MCAKHWKNYLIVLTDKLGFILVKLVVKTSRIFLVILEVIEGQEKKFGFWGFTTQWVESENKHSNNWPRKRIITITYWIKNYIFLENLIAESKIKIKINKSS